MTRCDEVWHTSPEFTERTGLPHRDHECRDPSGHRSGDHTCACGDMLPWALAVGMST